MAEQILMPRLSDTMTEGVIAAWHKKVGDPVKKGDLLAEVETDKATMDLESYKDGTLLYVGTDKGGKIQVNDLLAIIGAPGEDISALKQASPQAAEAPKAATAEAPKAAAPQPATPSASAPAQDFSKAEEVILMPRLSDTMTEGVIADWHKKVGDMVKKGDILADIETDKATMELESYKEGKLLYVGANKGEKIVVNDLLAIIGDEKKIDVNKIVASIKSQGNAAAPASDTQKEQPQAAQQAPVAQTTPAHETEAASVQQNGRLKASPLAKKLAAEKGINISSVPGTGDGGRVVKKDVDNFVPVQQKPAESQGAQQNVIKNIPPAPAGQVSFDDVPVSQMRKIIAKRLAESKFTAPHFYLTMSIDMDKAVKSRSI